MYKENAVVDPPATVQGRVVGVESSKSSKQYSRCRDGRIMLFAMLQTGLSRSVPRHSKSRVHVVRLIRRWACLQQRTCRHLVSLPNADDQARVVSARRSPRHIAGPAWLETAQSSMLPSIDPSMPDSQIARITITEVATDKRTASIPAHRTRIPRQLKHIRIRNHGHRISAPLAAYEQLA